MNLPFSEVLRFAQTKPVEMQRAMVDFFAMELPSETQEEGAFELFNEWLVYDFRQASGLSFLSEYIFVNPNKLDESIRSQMQEVAESAIYSIFEIQGTKPGEWIEVEEIISGKLYKVFDKQGSGQFNQGSIYARIGQVQGKWYLVGSNPVYIPITHTEEVKRVMREVNKNIPLTPVGTWQLLKSHGQRVAMPEGVTKKELKRLRKEAQKRYEKVQKKYRCIVPFEKITEMIYEENQEQISQFWQKLINSGVGEEFFIEETMLFQNIWNAFPHKCLGDKSPLEMLTQIRKG